MGIYNEALKMKQEIINNRNYLHQHPELGLDLPVTAKYVEEKLIEMGYAPQRIGECGIVATIGKTGGKCIMLRADMDALPIKEEADVEYPSTNENMHACGHDCHASALLGAARLLKAHEDELEGMVKLMFQPGEETMEGGKMMLDGGVCEGVDVAVGMHVFAGVPMKTGSILMTGKKAKMAAVDWFTINITGKGCHGAAPNSGVDPLNVMSHIHTALQTINSREMDPADNIVLTIGQMHGGHTSNVIPNDAYMTGTLRTLKNETRAMVKERMNAIVSGIAATFNAQASVEYGAGAPVLFHNQETYQQVKEILASFEGTPVIDLEDLGWDFTAMGSEDFAYVANAVPSVFMGIAAGTPEEGYIYPQHHPKARFSEDAIPSGAAAYAHIAIEWLKRYK